MQVFIWVDISAVSYNYHDDGGIVIVAESIERAREMMRVIGDHEEYDHKAGKSIPVSNVPSTCAAFTEEPLLILDTTHSKEEMFIFPDAGCC